MATTTPATDRLAAKVKAARSIGLWGVELTTQEADTLIAENADLRTKLEATLRTVTTAATITSEPPIPDGTEWPHTEYLIWSHERGWWKNAARGYTFDFEQAGLYPAQQAATFVERSCHAWAYYNKPGPPPDVMIPYEEDIVRRDTSVRKARAAAIAAREEALAGSSR